MRLTTSCDAHKICNEKYNFISVVSRAEFRVRETAILFVATFIEPNFFPNNFPGFKEHHQPTSHISRLAGRSGLSYVAQIQRTKLGGSKRAKVKSPGPEAETSDKSSTRHPKVPCVRAKTFRKGREENRVCARDNGGGG